MLEERLNLAIYIPHLSRRRSISNGTPHWHPKNGCLLARRRSFGFALDRVRRRSWGMGGPACGSPPVSLAVCEFHSQTAGWRAKYACGI